MREQTLDGMRRGTEYLSVSPQGNISLPPICGHGGFIIGDVFIGIKDLRLENSEGAS